MSMLGSECQTVSSVPLEASMEVFVVLVVEEAEINTRASLLSNAEYLGMKVISLRSN